MYGGSSGGQRTPRDDKHRRHSEDKSGITTKFGANSDSAYLGDDKSFNGSVRNQQPVVMSRFFGAIPPRPASTPPVPPPAAATSGHNPAIMTWDCVSHGSSAQLTSGGGSLVYSSASSTQSRSSSNAPTPVRPSNMPTLQRAFSLQGMSSGQAMYSSIPVMCKMPSAGKSFADLAETLQVSPPTSNGFFLTPTMSCSHHIYCNLFARYPSTLYCLSLATCFSHPSPLSMYCPSHCGSEHIHTLVDHALHLRLQRERRAETHAGAAARPRPAAAASRTRGRRRGRGRGGVWSSTADAVPRRRPRRRASQRPRPRSGSARRRTPISRWPTATGGIRRTRTGTGTVVQTGIWTGIWTGTRSGTWTGAGTRTCVCGPKSASEPPRIQQQRLVRDTPAQSHRQQQE